MSLQFRRLRSDHALHITFEDKDQGLAAIVDALGRAAQDHRIIGNLLRRAMAETMLPAIRDAYIAGLPRAVNMEVLQTDARHLSHAYIDASGKIKNRAGADDLQIISKIREFPTSEGHTLASIFDRMRNAQLRGDSARVDAIRGEYEQHKTAYQRSLQRLQTTKKEKKSSHLSSGLFRARAMEVMSLLVDAANIVPTSTGDAITVGIGNLAELDSIRTPSATEYILGKGPTKSEYDILWRHLEFGTGVHSVMAKRNTQFNEGLKMGGEWYYGKDPTNALLLRGSQPVHGLFDAQGIVNKGREFILLTEQYLGMLMGGRLK